LTATEADRNRRRGLAPWWRVRSWSKDLDTLIRLRKSLQALDADAGAEQEPFSAPALSAPPTELLAPPQDEVAQQDDGPEPLPVSDQASYPAGAYPHETTAPTDTAGQQAPGREMTARQMLSPDAPPAQASPDTKPPQTMAPEAGLGEAGPGRPADVPVPVTARPDPTIAAIRETCVFPGQGAQDSCRPAE
jgi:hypothetical protein